MNEEKSATPLTYTVPEAAALIGLCKTAFYAAVRKGEVPSLKIGRRIVIPRAALDRLLNGEVIAANQSAK